MSDFTTDAARATALGRVLGARLRHLRTDAGHGADPDHVVGADEHRRPVAVAGPLDQRVEEE
ncbi:hypothetical protein ABZ663_32385, partial [Streptomyces albidoflavus]|uniref:hypothetical protein n=1 Tax=Streptomyces albidoflavus TaxID=1886 RepID=UPI0033C7C569